MNRILHIGVILILLLSACSHLVEDADGIMYGEPIRFSPQVSISSRNLTLNSLYGREFGVRGYIYDKNSDWETKRSTQKPDSKWLNTRISCSDIGVCTYAPVQKWNSAMRYSFFAYYPYTENSGGEVTLSSTNIEDVPVATYTFNNQAFSRFDRLYDFMIANVIDVTDQYTSYVQLTFKHCLFAVNFVVNNLNEASTTIDDFIFKVNDIEFNKISVAMDGSEMVATNTKGGDIVATYDYLNSSMVIPSTLNSSPYNISENKALMFIPQKGLTGNISITLHGGTPQIVPFNYSGKSFEAGYSYIFSVQISGNDVGVELLQESEWNTFDNFIEFE